MNEQEYRKLLESKLMQRAQKMQAHIESAQYNSNRACLHPDAPVNCSGGSIGSHSVQRAMLKKIAGEDGKVYTPVAKATNSFSPYLLHKRGIDNASAFYGFCEEHDNDMFKAIENHSLEYTDEHASLLAFRSLSKELYNMNWLREVDLVGVGMPEKPDLIDLLINIPIDQHLLLERGSPYWAAVELRLMSDLYRKLGQSIVNGDFSRTSFYAIEFDRVPDILCSSLMTVFYDCKGIKLRDLEEDGPLDLLTFSLLTHCANGGAIVFGWYGESEVNERFIQSLHSLPRDIVPDTVARIVLRHSANFFAAPNWRESFGQSQQVQLDNLARNNIRSGPHPLTERGGIDFQIVDWRVKGNPTTNLTL